MRPDKPGLYWWEDNVGNISVIKLSSLKVVYGFGFKMSLTDFENADFFGRWLCQAHPPIEAILLDNKKVFC